MTQVTHEQLIAALRQYADELEALPEGQHVEVYQIGGANERLFDCGLWIRAEVTEEKCLSLVRLKPQHVVLTA